MIRIIIYILIFYVGYLVVRTFLRIQRSFRSSLKDKPEEENRFRNVEEADYREIDDSQEKKNNQN